MSEMIKGPRRAGRYPDRWLDCQYALEPVFLRLLEERGTPYIDVAAISVPIIDVACAAGWSVEDATSAIEELAVNYQLGVLANKRTDIAIAEALSHVRNQRRLN